MLLDTDCGNNDKATLGRPVDTVAILLVECLDMLESTDTLALDLFWGKE